MKSEKRLIDANELLEKHTCDVYGAYDDACMVKAVFVPYIKGAPTVDAAEVVRCRDCIHHEHYDALLYCGHTRGLAGSVAPDDFCSYGERK